jgi:hypothetical protein
MQIPAFLLNHTVLVEPLMGQYSQGAMYGEAVSYPDCYVEEKITLVRDKTGQEVVSSGWAIMPLTADVPVDSRVTVNNRPTTILALAIFDGNGLPTPDHKQVYFK